MVEGKGVGNAPLRKRVRKSEKAKEIERKSRTQKAGNRKWKRGKRKWKAVEKWQGWRIGGPGGAGVESHD